MRPQSNKSDDASAQKFGVMSPATTVKLALLSHILPPSPSGQSVMLHRLLRAVPAANYCLISRGDYSQIEPEEGARRLPVRYYHVRPEFQFYRPCRFGIYRARDLVNILLQVLQRARNVVDVVRREKCGAIMACSGDVVDIPAGYVASRWARVPFYAYLFDDYLYQWTRPLDRFFVRRAERIALKGAASVIVPNEFLRDEYRRRYGLKATVIHNPYEIEATEDESPPPAVSNENGVEIVYTGAVYHANCDALRNLVRAIESLDRPDLKLHLYTSQLREFLESEGLRGPVVYHPHLPPPEIHKIQRRADILFLPLAFDSGIPEVIKTSAPGKLGEYLASGRPILVHAPAGSFISWYFREHNCGVVVSRSDPAELARAIRAITDDPQLRRTVTENARARAKRDFSLESARGEFLKLFQLRGGAGANV